MNNISKEDHELASKYSARATDNLEDRNVAYDAYLAGMLQERRKHNN